MTDIYIADVNVLKDNGIFKRMYDSVAPVRQKKIDSYKLNEDKCLSLGAWILLEKALEIAGFAKDEISLLHNDAGKPYVQNCPFFNLSHSGDMVMCVVSDGEVGCDVEKKDRVNLKIADRYFSKSEIEQINSCEDKEEMFYNLWTLKESFVKATGLGLKIPLCEFSINIADDITIEQNIFPDKSFYFVQEQRNGYFFATCCEKNAFSQLNFLELV